MRRLANIAIRVIEHSTNVGGVLSGGFVLLMIITVLFEVFMRYIVNKPPMIADEFSGYMLVLISYLGIAYTWKEKNHPRIGLLVDRLPVNVATWLKLATLILAFAFSLVLVIASFNYMAHSFKLHMASATWLHTPLQGFQISLVIGFTLLAALLLANIAKAIMNMITKEGSGR